MEVVEFVLWNGFVEKVYEVVEKVFEFDLNYGEV